MRGGPGAWALLLFAAACASCSTTCPREGCDAMSSPAPGASQSGVAGAVAYESDVAANDCQTCGFSTTKLEVWSAPSAVKDDATARSVSSGGPPALTIDANGRYAQPLAPGAYVMCDPNGCAGFEVVAGAITTVNVQTTFGVTQFTVFDRGSRATPRGAY